MSCGYLLLLLIFLCERVSECVVSFISYQDPTSRDDTDSSKPLTVHKKIKMTEKIDRERERGWERGRARVQRYHHYYYYQYDILLTSQVKKNKNMGGIINEQTISP